MLSEFRTLTSAIVQGTLSASDVIYAPGGNSDQWNLNGGGDLSIIQSSSANWESTYTTVSSNSATWGTGGSVYDDSLLQAASGDWNSTYTTVSSFSATWGEGTSVTIQSTPPAAIDSEAGDLWFDDTSGKLFVYYADLNTDQWVDTSGGISDLDNVVTSPDTDPVAETTQLAEIIQITQAGYNALSPPAANTLYIIVN